MISDEAIANLRGLAESATPTDYPINRHMQVSVPLESLIALLDGIQNLQLEVDCHNDASTPAFDDIAALCGCPEWEYPGQVVRDVQTVVQERDKLRAKLTALADKLEGETLDETPRDIAGRSVFEVLAEERRRGYVAGHNDRSRALAKYLRGETDR